MLQNHHSPAKAPPDSSGSACSLCPSSDQKRYSSWVTDNCFYSAESCETHPLEIWMCINNKYIYIYCLYLSVLYDICNYMYILCKYTKYIICVKPVNLVNCIHIYISIGTSSYLYIPIHVHITCWNHKLTQQLHPLR